MTTPQSRAVFTLILAVLIASASAWLAIGSADIYCDRLPAITICATLSAFAIALCFRQFPGATAGGHKWLLVLALLIGAGTLFADARFVLKYRGICSQLQRQMQPTQP